MPDSIWAIQSVDLDGCWSKCRKINPTSDLDQREWLKFRFEMFQRIEPFDRSDVHMNEYIIINNNGDIKIKLI